VSLNFGAANSHVDFSIGNAANVSNGAFTMMVLWLTPASSLNSGLTSVLNSGTERRAFGMDTAHLFGDNDFSSGFGTLTASHWYWLALTKPAGSAHFRCHLRDYTTGGAWSHGEAVGAINQTDPGTSNSLQVGAGTSFASSAGDVAVAGVWTSELADLTIEALGTSALKDFMAGNPQWAARFMLSAPTSIQDLTGGGGNETGRTGTITASADPPAFDFLGAQGAISASRHPGRGPSRTRFYQTPRSTDIISAASVVNAPAEVTNATGTASAATVSIAPSAGVTSATGTAASPTASVAPAAEVTNATGTAKAPTASVAPSAGVANATGSAAAPTASVAPAAQVTNATGTAKAPTASVAPAAQSISASGSAKAPTPSVAPAAGVTNATGSAPSPSVAITVNAGLASGAGSAFDATVSTVNATNASAEVTNATGSAKAPSASVAPAAGQAAATGTAFNATVSTGGTAAPTAGLASASGSAFDATVRTVGHTRGVGWYAYLDIITEARMEAQRASQAVPLACPNDGQPLLEGPEGQFFCPVDGWNYPRDRDDEWR